MKNSLATRGRILIFGGVMTTEQYEAISKRNEALKRAEQKLREVLAEMSAELTEANAAVFGTAEEAQENTESQLFQLLQDRQTEAFRGCGVYRY